MARRFLALVRSYGNEIGVDEQGLMRWRIASINDLPIKDSERKYHCSRSPLTITRH